MDVFFSHVHTDDLDFVSQSISDSIAAMQDTSFFHRIIRRNGAIRDIHSESRATIDGQGKLIGFSGTTQDITDQKAMEAEFRRSEANLRTVFENTDVGFLFLSPTYAVLAFNKISIQWASNVFGIEIKDHSNFRELLLPDSRTAFDKFAGGILAGQAINYETSYPKPDGTLMWFTVGGKPVLDDGKVTGICLAITDITARRESEDKIQKISNLNAFIGQVNQNIVHIKDKKDLFKNACRIACEFGKFKIAWIGLFDEPKNMISLVEQCGLTQSQVQLFRNVSCQPNGPQECLLKNGGYYVSNDTEKEEGLQSWKPLGDELLVRSCMLLAIKKMDKVIGTLNLYSTEVGFFDTERIALLQEVTGDISFAIDMFEKADRQKEAEELVIKNEKRFRALIEKSSDMITLATADGEMIYGSPSVSDILGYAPEGFINKPGFDFVHPDDLPLFLEKRKNILKTPGGTFHVQQRLRHKNGHWLWCEDTDTNMLHDPDVNAIVSNFRDITERKNAEDKIKELNNHLEERVNERTAELTEANKALEAFSYSVSHDLNAPVRAIKGFTKIIMKDYGPAMEPDLKELFTFIEDSSNRMGALITDLLKLARYGKSKLKIAPVNMNELIVGIWANISRTTPNLVRLELADLPEVYADHSMIEQVVINLISNAVKYSAKKEKPTLKIWCERTERKFTFFFKDNGAGFDMRYYNRLFGPFQRLHSISEFEGTGVGLMLVKRIIEEHGGVVGAEGIVGQGATFCFTLPIRSLTTDV